MGAGPRFQFGWTGGLLFGVTVERFPYDWYVTLCFGLGMFSIGFGKPYDEVGYEDQ